RATTSPARSWSAPAARDTASDGAPRRGVLGSVRIGPPCVVAPADGTGMASNRADPQVLQAMCAQALSLHQAGRTAEAAAQYETVLRRNPKHPDALHLLGVLRMQSGDLAAAIPLLKGAVKANPRFPTAQSHLGLALFRSGRLP